MHLFFYRVLGIQTQNLQLVWQALYPLSHLGSLQEHVFYMLHGLILMSEPHDTGETQPLKEGSKGSAHCPGRQGSQL